MYKSTLAFVICFLLSSAVNQGFCQEKQSPAQLQGLADSLYKAKQFPLAADYYSAVADRSDFPAKKVDAYYNMACCLSLAGKTDSALIILEKAVKAGYDNKTHLQRDEDLTPLHTSSKWQILINSVQERKKILNADPAKASFITTDIHRFWEAYDRAIQDTAHFRQIIKEGYFDKATTGMNDYMSYKVSSIDFFVAHIRSAPAFYGAIRKNTFKTDAYKPAFLASYVKLKSIYEDAIFPDVYFVMGALTSGGTVSDAGLLLGVNQTANDSTVPLGELSFKQRTRVNNILLLPYLVAHELIHFQQEGMKNDTTTLSYVIREGMADFIGELISGGNGNQVLYDWAKGKEKQIWSNFTKDMYFNRYDNWIANSQRATPDNLPDQGYWIGYQICRSYYEQATNKKKAIYDMLHIQDYKAFFLQSHWEDKISSFL
ncbi:Predicted Zn-dependent protease [Chitinophaga sp. YR627]|uniref:TPR end-of-group domain-containing protein n=1 Tax=Chitinophaga sp. YR627 TaxID=1881041 RepID=UPI0008F2301B|nr:DUF2268 domain-containing putative Zn-dependent protease [Chitinophaga sp. YR627]SFM88391.1 Predicted Zn-dependent protease [Chitinophaga sp. YR627]